MAEFDDRSGRDSRLLALVIVIAVAVLVGLARFRFPQHDVLPAAVAPGPLERLAARATYDDLAAAVHTALQRVEPSLIAITIEPDPPPRASLAKGDAALAAQADARRRVGVRLDGDWAVVQVPRGFKPARTAAGDPLNVREVDPIKELAIISLPMGPDDDPRPSGASQLEGFAYVCAVEPTADGPTATPIFIGKIRTLLDERWGHNVLIPGGSHGLTPGSLLFELDGRFLGLVVAHPVNGVALVPASVLADSVAEARRLAGGNGGGK